MTIPRPTVKKLLASQQTDGKGAKVRRSIGNSEVEKFNPFVILDHLMEAGNGFPDHPHRGQQTITYLLKGVLDHESFTGSKGTVETNGVQSVNAGRGFVHAEMPRKADESGDDPEMVQVWLALPEGEDKTGEPIQWDLTADDIPTATPSDLVTIKVISGEAYGVKSQKDITNVPFKFYDYRVQSGGKISQPIPEGFTTVLYNTSGFIRVNDELIPPYHATLFGDIGDTIDVSVDENAGEEAQFLIIAAQHLNQPIVHNGPFVATSQDDIQQAIQDFTYHENGFERNKDWSSEFAPAK